MKDGSRAGDRPTCISSMNQDTVAAILVPCAVSALFDVEHATLWRLVSGGDKRAAFCSEFVARRTRFGLPPVCFIRFVQICVQAGDELCSNEDLGKCIVSTVLGKAMQEFLRLKL